MNRGTIYGDEVIEVAVSSTRNRKKMTSFDRSIARFTAFSSLRALRWLAVFAALAAGAAPATADAATRTRRAGGAYDGIWNTVFATTRGNCSSGYSVPFTVRGSRVTSAGGGRVSGSINRGGGVAVSVSVGASRASGGGRLGGNSGAGSWSGIISGDLCSGTWQATRS
jgi:hypothetical protein